MLPEKSDALVELDELALDELELLLEEETALDALFVAAFETDLADDATLAVPLSDLECVNLYVIAPATMATTTANNKNSARLLLPLDFFATALGAGATGATTGASSGSKLRAAAARYSSRRATRPCSLRNLSSHS